MQLIMYNNFNYLICVFIFLIDFIILSYPRVPAIVAPAPNPVVVTGFVPAPGNKIFDYKH